MRRTLGCSSRCIKMNNVNLINQAFKKKLVSFTSLFKLFDDDLQKRIDKNYNFSLHARPLSPAELNKYPVYKNLQLASEKEYEHFVTQVVMLDATEFMTIVFKRYNDVMLIFKVCDYDTHHVIIRTCKSITARWERIGKLLYFEI